MQYFVGLSELVASRPAKRGVSVSGARLTQTEAHLTSPPHHAEEIQCKTFLDTGSCRQIGKGRVAFKWLYLILEARVRPPRIKCNHLNAAPPPFLCSALLS